MPPFLIEKRGGAIRLSREWTPRIGKSIVLTKTYQYKAGGAFDEDLSFLCKWETAQIQRAHDQQVPHCVRPIQS